MINGAHAVIYSTNPDADRAFLRDVLKLPNVDVGRTRAGVPGGGKLGVYQPRHARPEAMTV